MADEPETEVRVQFFPCLPILAAAVFLVVFWIKVCTIVAGWIIGWL